MPITENQVSLCMTLGCLLQDNFKKGDQYKIICKRYSSEEVL